MKLSIVSRRSAGNEGSSDRAVQTHLVNIIKRGEVCSLRMSSKEFRSKDGTVLVFREPVETDGDGLRGFINDVIKEPMSGIVLNDPIDADSEARWLSDRLSVIKAQTAVDLLVELDGRIVGNCDIVRRIGKERHRADMGIALSQEIRGIGVGKALMKATMQGARERMEGLESIWLSAFAYNERALALYQSLGFKILATLPRAVKEGSAHYDEVILALDM